MSASHLPSKDRHTGVSAGAAAARPPRAGAADRVAQPVGLCTAAAAPPPCCGNGWYSRPSTGSPPSISGAASKSEGSAGAPPRPPAAVCGRGSPLVHVYELSVQVHIDPSAPNRTALSLLINVSAPGAGPKPRPPPPPPPPPGTVANGKVSPVYLPPDASEIADASLS